MKITVVNVGALPTDCYIVETKERNAIVVDPADEAEVIMCALEKDKLSLKKILLTHGHFDHIGAVAELVRETGAEVYINALDAEMTKTQAGCLGTHFPEYPFTAFTADHTFSDGDKISLDELTFTVMHTPGHTAGSSIFISENVIFSGDTLFEGSIGRVDFPMSDPEKMKESLKKIAAIEGDYTIYPGHGAKTTLAEEKEYNMYLRGAHI